MEFYSEDSTEDEGAAVKLIHARDYYIYMGPDNI